MSNEPRIEVLRLAGIAYARIEVEVRFDIRSHGWTSSGYEDSRGRLKDLETGRDVGRGVHVEVTAFLEYEFG